MSTTWDTFVKAHDGHILQTSQWGKLKSDFGWQSEIVTVEHDDQIDAGALLLFRPLPFNLGSIAYVPRGPVVDWQDEEDRVELLPRLDAMCKQKRAILLKWEPELPDTPDHHDMLSRLGFRMSPQDVQPPRTIVIDVQATDDEILARMNQGTRRKIRQSLKREVAIRHGTASDLDSFNTLMAATGSRNEFGVHSPAYYQRAFDLFSPDHVTLLMASYEGQDLGGLMLFAQGSTAWYFYGATSNEERQRMAAYGLQWAAIQWARERGCATYDMWGIPDYDETTLEAEFRGRDDGLWGVYGFKRGFGGRVIRSVGAWDRVYNPVLYRLYRMALASRGALSP